MHDDRADAQPQPEDDEGYVTPELSDLGSFEELTRFNPGGPFTDTEGFSG